MITVVLDDVYQPHNASAVLRTCECFGIQDVHAVERRNAYEINEDIALGAAKWLTLHRHPDLGVCLSELRCRGYRLVATTPHGADCALEELPVDTPSAMLLGTEECRHRRIAHLDGPMCHRSASVARPPILQQR
jgi:tRNA (guanosine-2'-O-)-methyltransferase